MVSGSSLGTPGVGLGCLIDTDIFFPRVQATGASTVVLLRLSTRTTIFVLFFLLAVNTDRVIGFAFLLTVSTGGMSLAFLITPNTV